MFTAALVKEWRHRNNHVPQDTLDRDDGSVDRKSMYSVIKKKESLPFLQLAIKDLISS